MSLEDLRAQAEAEENEAEQPEVEEPEQEEPEQEEVEEPEADAEESDDFELELEGEPEPGQQKYDPVEVLQHKLSRERKKKRDAKSEVDELKEQVQKLTQMLQGGQQPQQPAQQANPQSQPGVNYPAVPLLYEDYKGKTLTTREEYNAAYQDWMRECRQVDERHNQAEKTQNQNRERFESMTKELAGRAAKFASENKVSVDRVADALDKATSEIDEATGIDGSLAYLLDSVGDGSERVAYYVGTNSNALTTLKGLLRDDPNGFKAVAKMAEWKKDLKRKHSKQVSKAPEPDQPLKGDSAKGSAQAKKVQAMWDKAKTPQEMMEARRKARELGVKLDI